MKEALYRDSAAPKPVRVAYSFLREAGLILNSGQSRTLMMTGEINDVFYDHRDTLGDGAYVPLVEFLRSAWSLPDTLLISYRLNGPIRLHGKKEIREKLEDAWAYRRTGIDPSRSESFTTSGDKRLEDAKKEFREFRGEAIRNPTKALYFLKELCAASRRIYDSGPVMEERLLIIIEGVEFLLPQGEISSLSDPDRRRAAICMDWFSDPEFTNGKDAVVLIAESRSLVNRKVASLPQMLTVDVTAPNEAQRDHCIRLFAGSNLNDEATGNLVEWTAGLSSQAIIQLLRSAKHQGWVIDHKRVSKKVEEFIQARLGEGVVTFKRPTHTMKDVVGNTQLKTYLREKLIPRFRDGRLSGATVCGAIGCGKTFTFEAVAAELNIPVLELKQIRSKWFGETDLIVERLRRLLSALGRVAIFLDEADAKFSDLAGEQHATEKRVTGAIQEMMSDRALKGRVIWLVMTARIHLLPPDMLRDGRVGDLVIPIMDPEGDDRKDFIDWALRPASETVRKGGIEAGFMKRLAELTKDYSAASFEALRSELANEAAGGSLTSEQILEIIEDILPANIAEVREYQILQAKLHCRRKSLLPDGKYEPQVWRKRIQELEALGIR